MGNFNTMGRMSIIMFIYIMALMMPVALAANDTDSPTLFIGDPIKAFKQLPSGTQSKVTMIVGLVAVAALIMGIIALFASHIKTSAGAAIGNAGMRNEGTHNMLVVVGVALLLMIALGVFWFFMTGGI